MYTRKSIKGLYKFLFAISFFLAIAPATFAQKKKQTAAPAAAPADASLSPANIQKALDEAYEKFKDIKEGKNADYIKELAKVDPNIYGIAIVMTDGTVYTKGDLQSAVSIQSISKVFTMAKVIEEQGPK